MNERPILFCGDMVRAILDGRKTETRRVVKPQPKHIHAVYPDGSIDTEKLFRRTDQRMKCPHGQVGDRLWVRETWMQETEEGIPTGGYLHRATDAVLVDPPETTLKWKPSIFMPKGACRIWLEIVGVRVERVQEITVEGALAEGITSTERYWKTPDGAVGSYRNLWDRLNKKRGFGWDKNPWVWVVQFERIDPVDRNDLTDEKASPGAGEVKA